MLKADYGRGVMWYFNFLDKKNVNNINTTLPPNEIKSKRTALFSAKEKKIQSLSKGKWHLYLFKYNHCKYIFYAVYLLKQILICSATELNELLYKYDDTQGNIN